MSTQAGRWTAATVLAVAAIGGGVAWWAADDGGSEVFCTADALRGDAGKTFGRGGGRCLFADDEGNVLTTLPNGDPLCYGWIIGQESKATEGGDQVFPCDDPPPGVGNAYRPG